MSTGQQVHLTTTVLAGILGHRGMQRREKWRYPYRYSVPRTQLPKAKRLEPGPATERTLNTKFRAPFVWRPVRYFIAHCTSGEYLTLALLYFALTFVS